MRAIDEAWLSSDLGLPIIALPFKEGDAFNQGDLLAEFDCASIRSQLTAAEAKLDAESILLKNSEQLKNTMPAASSTSISPRPKSQKPAPKLKA